MRIIASIWAVAALALAAEAAAQNWAVAPEPRRATRHEAKPTTSKPQQQKAPFAAQRNYDPQRERCENFRRELAQVRQQERETTSTGARDHAGLRRQQILEQRQRAGC